VTPARREYLEPLVKQTALEYKIVLISPVEIDRMRKKISLNELEAVKIAQMLHSLKTKPGKILIDAADSVEENYTKRITSCLQKIDKNFRIPEIISEHKADDKYVEVSGASILAKVERDRQVEKLRQKHGNFGSGYPSDETTQKHIKELLKNGPLPDYVRKSWNTVSQNAPAGTQKKLDEY
jgi:ribonuclease HII